MVNDTAKKIGQEALKAGALALTVRYVGRAASPLLWAVSAYDGYKTFQTFQKENPVAQELVPFYEQASKWHNAISCIGSTYTPGQFGSLDEGGAINALMVKKLCSVPHPDFGISLDGKPNAVYHQPYKKPLSKKDFEENDRLIEPNPKEAKRLIKDATMFMQDLTDLFDTPDFDKKTASMITRLQNVNRAIKHDYVPGTDYSRRQETLYEIVQEMKPIALDYQIKIQNLEEDLHKKRFKHLARAGVTATAAAIVGRKFFKVS